MPAKPRLATREAAQTDTRVTQSQYETWDQLVGEATADIEPYVLPLPDGTKVEIPCPTGRQMEAFAVADRTRDENAAMGAMFGPDLAPTLMLATADLPFFVRAQIVNKIMMHYGMQVADVPNL